MKKMNRQSWETMRYTGIIMLVFFLSLLFVPADAMSAATKDVVYTSATKSNNDTSGDGSIENPYNRFEDAVANVADGGKIYILASDNAFLNTQENDMPFIIDKNVVIEPEPGASQAILVSRSAGIILGADVTFNNIELDFANGYHDQVFANGYSLSMIHVSRNSSHRLVDLVAGGLYDTNGNRMGPEPGKKGQILVQGSCEFGNIYAGSINGIFDGEAAICIRDATGSVLGDLYASGAKEAEYDRDNWFDINEPPAPAPEANLYSVTGKVTISIDNAPVKLIEGSGAKEGTAVNFSTEYLSSNLSLTNIAELSVLRGALQPAVLTAWEREKINLCIAANGTLDLSGQGNVEVNNFIGGGKLVLESNSVIKVAGDLTGETVFETKGGYSGHSGIAVKDHVYIEARPDTSGTFTFVPYPTQSNMKLVKWSDGNWIIIAGSEIFIMYDTEDSGKGEVSINWESLQPDTGSPEGAIAEAKPGYHFVNWTDEGGNEVSRDVHFIPPKIDGVYTEQCYLANFAANSYQVAYEANGGTGNSMTGQIFFYNEKQPLQANPYSREGYVFDGWNTMADGSGIAFTDQQEVTNLTTEQDGRIILFAQWTESEKPVIPDNPAKPDTPGEPDKPTDPDENKSSGENKEPVNQDKKPVSIPTPTADSEKKQPSKEISSKPNLTKPSVKLKGKKKCIKVKFKKVNGADGYEIYRSGKRNKGYRKIVTIKKTTYKNVRLKSKRKYYYKVRAYRKVNGKKVYSAYSKVRGARAR